MCTFIFKAPYRKQNFKLMKPNVPLPPKPISTKWGTWLDAAEYYCDHLEDIREVMEEFNENHSEALRQSKELTSNENLIYDSAFIKLTLSASGMLSKDLSHADCR